MEPPPSDARPGPGIPFALARDRVGRISALTCHLTLTIPPDTAEAVSGTIALEFDLADADRALALDFTAPPTHVTTVTANGRLVTPVLSPGHLAIPSGDLASGRNTLVVEFVAGAGGLHRRTDLVYSLFVPARASRTFPCFDQPDLKARWRVSLVVAPDWLTASNGVEVARTVAGERVRLDFGETSPLPTYLLAVVAGRLDEVETSRNGREFRVMHAPAERGRVARALPALDDLHAEALAWLEDYTGIRYPFGPFDLVLIPSFQFSGMEHPGLVYYDAGALLLDSSASRRQELARAGVIAHETAHMWFGNLVTMPWFDDVWMKEVFASLFASRIVDPAFPDLDPELRFILQHYPPSYDLDRTAGAAPIREPLDNLDDAGSLYGPAIYHKAPIAMRQLEHLVGDDVFRRTVRTWLQRHRFGNAGWPAFVRLLDERSGMDASGWSRTWIETPGCPALGSDLDPDGARLRDYGRRELDARSRDRLASSLPTTPNAVQRGAAAVALWEEMLAGRLPPPALVDVLVATLETERDDSNLQYLLSRIDTLFWRFTRAAERPALAARLEPALRAGLDRAPTSPRRAAWFGALRSIALSADGVDWLTAVWQQRRRVEGLPLGEADSIALACDLALRPDGPGTAVVDEQIGRLKDGDARDRLTFLRPALSADPAIREGFARQVLASWRAFPEAWVLEAMARLHHPLRAATARALVVPSLDGLRAIARTGDIFFPRRWAATTLSGYQDGPMAETVTAWVDQLPGDYPPRLRRMIQAAADPLWRAARILDGWTGRDATRASPAAT